MSRGKGGAGLGVHAKLTSNHLPHSDGPDLAHSLWLQQGAQAERAHAKSEIHMKQNVR